MNPGVFITTVFLVLLFVFFLAQIFIPVRIGAYFHGMMASVARGSFEQPALMTIVSKLATHGMIWALVYLLNFFLIFFTGALSGAGGFVLLVLAAVPSLLFSLMSLWVLFAMKSWAHSPFEKDADALMSRLYNSARQGVALSGLAFIVGLITSILFLVGFLFFE